MKRSILLLIALVAASSALAAYDKKLIYVLEQLRQCKFDENTPLVGGPAIGYAGIPHEFYLLFPYVDRLASQEDLQAMLRDKSAVVRIMAAKCILGKKEQVGDLKKSVEVLNKDVTKVYVMPFGCVASLQTVSEVVGELQKDPDFLGDPKEPLEPIKPIAPFEPHSAHDHPAQK